MSILIAKYFHKKEERWLAYKKKGDAEVARAMTLEGANEIAIEESRRRKSEHYARRSMSGTQQRRMSERHSREFNRQEMREQINRRVMTENDITRPDLHNERKRRETLNGYNPSVPAIPPRKTQELARQTASPRVSGETHRTLSPHQGSQDNGTTDPPLHVAQSP